MIIIWNLEEGSKGEERRGGKNCIMRSFIFCLVYEILLLLLLLLLPYKKRR
jgi:hypothetical protein